MLTLELFRIIFFSRMGNENDVKDLREVNGNFYEKKILFKIIFFFNKNGDI